jgi:hypothetical protein
MGTFHVDAEGLRAYAQDRLDEPAAWSVEAHLDGCASCRAALPVSPDLAAAVAAARPVDLRHQGRVRPATPRRRITVLLTTGPGTRMAWFVAVLVTLVLITLVAVEPGFPSWLLLLITPALPVLGTAASQGPQADPLHEMIAASPYGGIRIVLWRTLSVLAVSIPVAAIAGIVSGLGSPVVWLLPGVALTALTLGIGALVDPALAATGVAVAWAVLILTTATDAGPAGELVTATSAPIWLAVIGAAAALIAARRDHLTREVRR